LLAVFGLIVGSLVLLFGGINLALTGLQQIFSDFYDFRNFSLVNLFNPFTSVGGSGTFLDSLVAGRGASGGSAVRYWMFMAYGMISVLGWTICAYCWKVITNEK
jgi:hypothetical protein